MSTPEGLRKLRTTLRPIVRIWSDYQEMRKRTFARLGLKKGGEPMDFSNVEISRPQMDGRVYDRLVIEAKDMLRQERRWLKFATDEFHNFSIAEWLYNVKGIGDAITATLLSEVDITKATTVSKLWAYGGLAQERPYNITWCLGEIAPQYEGQLFYLGGNFQPEGSIFLRERKPNRMLCSTVWGTSPNNAKLCIPLPRSEDELERHPPTFKDIILLDAPTQGQRPRKGQLTGYNTWFRAKLLGVLGPSLLKVGGPYAVEYNNYKDRLWSEVEQMASPEAKLAFQAFRSLKEEAIAVLAEQKAASARATNLKHGADAARKRGFKLTANLTRWGSPDHIHKASIRYMVKAFLRDLYVAWRSIEGLSVRAPYHEAVLGHVHEGQPDPPEGGEQ